jgi:murein DD-endopeptidase MepM/ murein hydrolase activator NlpD
MKHLTIKAHRDAATSAVPVRMPWARRLLATAAVGAVLVTSCIVGQANDPAYAATYPSWDDVQAARSDESTKQAEIERIQGILKQLEDDAAAKQALAVERGNEHDTAVHAFDEAGFKLDQLLTEAASKQADADRSKLRAGQLAAQLSRSGGEDVAASLFFDSAAASDLLSQLGMASKITDQSAGVYAKATQDQNAAQALADQATIAKVALKDLADAAEAALEAANAASDAAAAALDEQQDNQAVLQAQLAVLVENRQATESDFQAGVNARAAAAAELARRQAAAAAASASTSRSTGSAVAGSVSPTGWTLPASGALRSPYGWRLNPYSGVYALHAGADIGAACNQAIYAAHAGTVTQSGWSGGYGNFIQIANGDGVSTAYGHIVNGGLLVPRGATVAAGQLIALVGSTGGSTGCHLHFEVRINGSAIEPVGFMRDRGVTIG